MDVEVKIFNNANKDKTPGIIGIMFTGCIEINGGLLVDCDTTPVNRKIFMQSKSGTIVWKSTKHDYMGQKTINFNIKGDGNDIIEIRNAPSFDGVIMIVNGKLLKGQYKRYWGLS
jgi:hypothetical protein